MNLFLPFTVISPQERLVEGLVNNFFHSLLGTEFEKHHETRVVSMKRDIKPEFNLAIENNNLKIMWLFIKCNMNSLLTEMK